MRRRTKTLAFFVAFVLALLVTLPINSRKESPSASFFGELAGELCVIHIEGIYYRFRWCPPGTFTMGSPESEQDEDLRSFETAIVEIKESGKEVSEEKLALKLKRRQEQVARETQHQVTLTHGFWLLETEVTQAMWESIMEENPSVFRGSSLPVENVTWNDCQEFITRLNDLGVAPGGSCFSLPTEAQWEYACRAGTTTPYFWGSSLNGAEANCDGTRPYGTEKKGECLKRTTPVNSYAANPWGLFDMHGNVSEWCQDGGRSYPLGNVTNPRGPTRGLDRVVRGGSWGNSAPFCRSADRYFGNGERRRSYVGFRLALVPQRSRLQRLFDWLSF